MNYEDEYEERDDLEKSLDGVGIEYLHCSTCAYIYVEGKIVYDVSKSDMIPTGDCEVFFPLNQVAIMSEKRWCDARWFANRLAQSIKLWKIDDMSSQKLMNQKHDETFPDYTDKDVDRENK